MQVRAPVSHSRVADIAERPISLQASLGDQTTSYQPSHPGLSPNTRPWSQPVLREKVTCFACGNQRHTRRQCPVKVEPINAQFSGLALMEGGPQTGSVLRKSGHIGEKQSDDILLDMGSTQTLIRKDMLTADAVSKGETSIMCTHGDVQKYPKAEVIDGRSFYIRVDVLDNLPVAALIGQDLLPLIMKKPFVTYKKTKTDIA